jgi:hypothetical protein
MVRKCAFPILYCDVFILFFINYFGCDFSTADIFAPMLNTETPQLPPAANSKNKQAQLVHGEKKTIPHFYFNFMN